MEARDQITEQFRAAVRKSETEAFPAMDKVWERVTAQLDQDKKEDKKVIPFRKISLAAAVLIVLGLGIAFFTQYNTDDTTIVSQPKEKAQPVKEIAREKEEPLIVKTDTAKQNPIKVIVAKTENGNSRYTAHKPFSQTKNVLLPADQTDALITFKGKIVDENGEPIPGATIRIKGTSRGTVSDMDGNYAIETQGQQTLELRMLNMESKEIVTQTHQQGIISTTLNTTSYVLQEAVIAAPYGPPVTRERYVGAADRITATQIERRPVRDFSKAIEGGAPGIQVTHGNGQPGYAFPGNRYATNYTPRNTYANVTPSLTGGKNKQIASSEIKIRGSASVTAHTTPLVIVDGVPYGGDFSDINKGDIKEVVILKDAEATTLYGARGSNNVIIISTKEGKGLKAKTGFFRKFRNLFRKKQNYSSRVMPQQDIVPEAAANGESYNPFVENPFENPAMNPLSTFSIDVDNAAYTNIRRFINNGQAVPADAVRIEEMVNFFHYQYPQPTDKHPFSINTDYSDAAWNPKHKLLRIGLQGKIIPVEELPASNLVFLVDVSGSMSDPNKLPLLKSSMKLLVAQLRKEDKVAIVVYAGAAGLVLPPTSGDKKEEIINALEKLQAGGSTAGGAGIELAYKIAQENFMKNGNNRVILATDGDFNVGSSSDTDMQTLIEQKRKSNIFLTCLGYGMGNYKDSKMEILADKGNGNYAYIDNLQEANRFLVKEFSGTMYSIAKDVKIQIEFNPQYVQSYRLIGYENRKLKTEDFVNDAIDAGELGSGHTVTALYEIIPTGTASEYAPTQPSLKYNTTKQGSRPFGNELATVKFRYKKTDGDKSMELVQVIDHKPVALSNASADFKLASAVAWFGLKLRDSKLVPDKSKTGILNLAKAALAKDDEGYKAEFIRLVEAAQ